MNMIYLVLFESVIDGSISVSQVAYKSNRSAKDFIRSRSLNPKEIYPGTFVDEEGNTYTVKWITVKE